MRIQLKLILIGFIVIAVLMTVVGVVTFSAFQKIDRQVDEIAEIYSPATIIQ